MGSLPSSRRQCPSPHLGRRPLPTLVPPSTFRTSSTGFSSSTSWACFIPLPRSGFSLQGVAPATQPNRLVGGRCPLVVGDDLPAEGTIRRRQVSSRRPQGFAPVSRSVVPGEVVNLGQDPCPLLRVLLLRALLRGSWRRLRVASARGLGVSTLRVFRGAGPQRINRSTTRPSVPRGSSRSSFVAFATASFRS